MQRLELLIKLTKDRLAAENVCVVHIRGTGVECNKNGVKNLKNELDLEAYESIKKLKSGLYTFYLFS